MSLRLKSAMTRLQLTPMHFADLCGVNRVQVWRWLTGKAPIPQYAWTILALIEGEQYQEILRAGSPAEEDNQHNEDQKRRKAHQ